MKGKIRVNLKDPVLVMGYDWERYGKWDDDERNLKDQADSLNGIRAIVNAHEEYNAPLTLFVLGKLLEVPVLKQEAENIRDAHFPQLVDYQQHTYSHIMIKTNVLRGAGVDIDKIQEDLSAGKTVVEGLTGEEVVGFGSAQSFYQGLLGEVERQRAVCDVGIKFIRSDGRGPGDTRPAPGFDEDGYYRGPYFYEDTPALLEIPAHGYSDNYLKGLSKEKPEQVWSTEWEFEEHRKYFDVAIENKSHFAPLTHEWSLGRCDPSADVIHMLLAYAKQRDVEVVTYYDLFKRIARRLQ